MALSRLRQTPGFGGLAPTPGRASPQRSRACPPPVAPLAPSPRRAPRDAAPALLQPPKLCRFVACHHPPPLVARPSDPLPGAYTHRRSVCGRAHRWHAFTPRGQAPGPHRIPPAATHAVTCQAATKRGSQEHPDPRQATPQARRGCVNPANPGRCFGANGARSVRQDASRAICTCATSVDPGGGTAASETCLEKLRQR